MTDFHVECVQLGAIEKHPNADTLGITQVGAYPVIVKLGDFKPGDLAVYVPVDAVVPGTDERWAFLGGHLRIKAKRLRGVFSQGLVIPAPLGVSLGDDCSELLGIKRYETPEERSERQEQGPFVVPRNPEYLPRYSDLENIRRWPDVLRCCERVVVMEKLEGENVRVAYVKTPWWKAPLVWLGLAPRGRLVVGSRNQIKTSGKWIEATAFLLGKFEAMPDPERYSLYGESFGYTKGFPYGGDGSAQFRLFDAWDRVERRWLDWPELNHLAESIWVQTPPLLYWGDWDPVAGLALAEGESILDPSHVREGFVVRPTVERTHPGLGRVILKCKGEGYLLRKDG